MIVFPVRSTKPNILVRYKSKRINFENTPWSLDVDSPNKIVESFSSLFVKKDIRLVVYLFSSMMGGNGFVYAVPKDEDALSLSECEIQKDLHFNPPKPYSALSSFMEAIDGDKSPLSYLQAAILYNELCELGASWHGVSWGQTTILPVEDPEQFNLDYKWELLEEEPEIINPHFYYDDNDNPIVVFYTINDIGTITLNEDKYIFNKENYTFRVQNRLIATAGPGIIF